MQYPDDADELRNMRLLMREEKRKLDEWNRISRETMLWQESLQSTSTMKAA